MEDEQEYLTSDTSETPIKIKLEYFINKEDKKEGQLPIISFCGNNDIIGYKDITYSFYSFLKNQSKDVEFADIKQNYIIYEYIGYFNGKGLIQLQQNDYIFIGDNLTFDILKILIKATIFNDEKIHIKKKYENLEQEINYISSYMLNEDKIDSLPQAPLNLIVLTANPLMDTEGNKELRTMNDFDIIKSNIYNLFSEKDVLNHIEFAPLTKQTLKYFISNEEKRPVILHLICKSTYKITKSTESDGENKDQSSDFTNLIFENDYDYNQQKNNYNSVFMDKTRLKSEIFDYESNPTLEKNVNKITLIISTQLAEDVFDIFKDFGFKNIIVQHTTLANLSFVVDFNKTFYRDLIMHFEQPIYEIYEDALNIPLDKVNPPTFCCCFHKHNNDCEFMKNLINEIYNNNYKIISKNSIEDIFKEIETSIPHFFHLWADCPGSPKCNAKIEKINLENIKSGSDVKYPENSFSLHNKICYSKFQDFKQKKNVFQVQDKEYYNICCCDINPEKHNINYIFKTDFTRTENNNLIKFRKKEFILKEKYIPYYDKMELLVGKNKFIFDVIKFLFSNELNLNIYGDNIENMRKFGNIIKEYYFERYYFYETNVKFNEKEKEQEKELEIKKNKSTPSLCMDTNKIDFCHNIINDDIKLKVKQTSLPISLNKIKRKINIVEIDLFEEDKNILQDNVIDYNNIYFIYVHDAKLIDKVNFKKNKAIWFSKESIKGTKFNKTIELTKEPLLNCKKYYKNICGLYLNEYIKFQNQKDVINSWRRKEKK